jgi:apolipoprotein N-acyltransferase
MSAVSPTPGRPADIAWVARLGDLMDNRLARIAAAIVSGGLLYFVVGLNPVWWLAWVAPIPILAAAYRARALEAFLLALLAGLIAATSHYTNSMAVGGLPVVLITFAIFGLLWSLTVSVARAVARGTGGWAATLAYPLAWAAADAALSYLSPHGTMGSLAYSQMEAVPVIQVAALFGTAGVTFLISIPASAAAVALAGLARDRPRLAYGVPLVLLALGLVYGGVRLAEPLRGAPVTFGLATIDRPDQPLEPQRPDAIWDLYVPQATRLAQAGATAVILPESISYLDTARQQALSSRLSSLAQQRSIYLVAGIDTLDDGRAYNSAWIFQPTGARLASYVKQHLVPGFEASHAIPGHSLVTFPLAGHAVGVAICKDMDFPDLARQYAARDVEALIVPASDFGVDGWLHARMAVLRGVEDGFSVVRTAEHGMITVSDPFGRVAKEIFSRDTPGTSLVSQVSLGPRLHTFYSGAGHLFGGLSFAAVALWALALTILRLRRRA